MIPRSNYQGEGQNMGHFSVETCAPPGSTLSANQQWTILLEDLADSGNGLPDSLKASLISIGIWMLKRTEEIRQGETEDFSALIEISENIRKGLGRH
jgi:flagellar biosynthesis regulator FlaF